MRRDVLTAMVCLLVTSICPAQPGATGGESSSPSIGSNPVDNVSLLVGDVGVVRIVSPHDTIPACSSAACIARIANFGEELAEVWFAYFWLVDPQGVRLFSWDTCLLMRVPAHESIDVRFGYFNVGLDTGQWVATCWFPSGDTNPQNDSLSGTFWVMRRPGVEESGQPTVCSSQPTATVVRGVVYRTACGTQDTEHRAELLDATGRKVLVLKPGANDVRRLSPGVYFTRRSDEKRPQRIVVVR